jgi:hypothetical protein
LQRAIHFGAEFLLIVPSLGTSGDQGFLLDLIAALNDVGFRSIQTVVADQETPEGLDAATIPELFRTTNILFWQDFWIGRDPELLRLAQLVSLLHPRVTIVANSRCGRDLIVQFGRALSQRTKIYCIYDDAGRDGDFDMRFPRRTLPFATGLTDDAQLGAQLRNLYGDLLGHGVVVLPRHSNSCFRDAVAAAFRRT